jgi:cation:H+ antiporter
VPLAVLLLLVGLALLVGGAELLVRGGGQLALGLRVPPLVVGLTVVAFGTSTPELAVSISAAFSGSTDAAMGNVLGSNIANVLLVLGVGALAAPLLVDRSLIRREIPALLVLQLLLPLLCFDGKVGWIDGLVLVGLGLFYNGLLVRQALKDRSASVASGVDAPKSVWWRDVLFLLVGIGLLVGGAQVFVGAALEIAGWLGWSDRFIGLTVIAIGTSAPELVTTAVSAFRGEVDIAIGNVVGSNILNLAIVLGLTAIVQPVVLADAGVWLDLGVASAVAVILVPIALALGRIGRPLGAVLVLLYAGYLALSY